MKAEIAERWAAALRSGGHLQGFGALGTVGCGGGERPRRCCLGVLCDLAVKAGVEVEVETQDSSSIVCYDGKVDFLPDSVREWAGMRTDQGMFLFNNGHVEIPDGRHRKLYASLAAMNDDGCSFEQIGEAIEEWRDDL